jgi:hypothetical protein
MASKNEVLKFLSVRSILIPPARTGRASINRKLVMIIDHTNRLRSMGAMGVMLITVVTKLMAPKILDTPAICKDRMARSTLAEGWPTWEERGGYMVQPVPRPSPDREDRTKR